MPYFIIIIFTKIKLLTFINVSNSKGNVSTGGSLTAINCVGSRALEVKF